MPRLHLLSPLPFVATVLRARRRLLIPLVLMLLGAVAPMRGARAETPTATPGPIPAPGPSAGPTSGCTTPAWRPVSSPSTRGMFGVAAVAPNDVWAAGDDMFHWDGGAWHDVPQPVPAQWGAVAAGAADSVWAVGASPAPGYVSALVEHWDGSHWTILGYGRTRQPAASSSANSAVTTTGPDDAWVVGDTFSSGETDAGLFHCSRTGCSGGAGIGRMTNLSGVAAVSNSDIWVVGQAADAAGVEHSLIGHWDGTTLTRVPSPDAGLLTGVTALAANDVWAVSASAILHWDGSAWQVVPSPAGARAVAARTSTDIWAVGGVIQHWDGAAWSIVATPSAPLFGVSPLAADDVWAVGGAPSVSTTIEHYSRLPTFGDVPPGAYFTPPVVDLVCRGVLSGYADGSFRPFTNATRGQLVKIVVGGFAVPAYTPPAGAYTFADVLPAAPFWPYAEAAAHAGIVSGYACGGPGGGCDGARRPYFRPGANVTRSQLAKLVVTAAGWSLRAPAQATFVDVAPGSAFYAFVETAACHGVLSGYACGGPDEPCSGGMRPYFRPGASAIRAQVAKIVDLAITAGVGSCSSAAPGR